MKKLVNVASLIMAFMMITLTGCGNPYAGNYKTEATEEQKQEALTKLETYAQQEEDGDVSDNMQITSKAEFEMEGEIGGINSSLSLTANAKQIYDCSEKDNIKVYVKVTFDIKTKSGGNSGSAKTEMEMWTEEKGDKTYVSYTLDSEGNKVSEKGYLNGSETESYLEDMNLDVEINAQAVVSAIGAAGAKVYIDGNKIKAVVNEGKSNEIIYYVIFNSDMTYKAKVETSFDLNAYFGNGASVYSSFVKKNKLEAEIVPTSSKVNIPSGDGYANEINLTLFQSLSAYLGMGSLR